MVNYSLGILFHTGIESQIILFSNFGANLVWATLSAPFFYYEQTFPYSWFIYPGLIVISNILFWWPIVYFIGKLIKKSRRLGRFHP